MRKFIDWIVLCVFIIGFDTCSAGAKSQSTKYSTTRTGLFDTVVQVTGYTEKEEDFHALTDVLFSELSEYDKLYSIYEAYDGIVNLYTINKNAGGEALAVDSRLFDLLQFGRSISDATGGKIDITAGSILKEWHEAREASLRDPDNAFLPDSESLAEAARHTGFDKLVLDNENQTARLTDPDTRIDIGAIAKGYAVQRVSEMLPSGWLINAGGNVYAKGSKPNGSPWLIGIQDPESSQSSSLIKLSLPSGAVVTSGDYQCFYTVNGTAYHHIIDLDTLYPAGLWHSVTIWCQDSAVADGLSTALFVMTKEKGENLLKQYDARALWIDLDMNITMSEAMEAYVQINDTSEEK